MNRRIFGSLAGAALIGAVAAGCQPDSIIAAREQLGRGPNDTIGIVLPLVNDSFFVANFLDETDVVTMPSGLLGLRVNDGAVTFDYASVLQSVQTSTNVVFSSPGQGAAAQVPGTARDTIRFSTPDGTDVIGATVTSGWIVREMTNSSGCDANVSVLVLDDAANPIVSFPANVFVGNATTVTDSVDAVGATMNGFADILPSVSFGVCVPGGNMTTIITFRPMVFSSVTLDNLNESFAVEESQELLRSDVGFDDLEDAIKQSTLNDATVDLTVVNSADVPLRLDNFTIGAVRLDAGGQLVRDGGGNLVYEQDAGGTPILIAVASPGFTTLNVPRNGSTIVAVQSAALVDAVVQILLDDERVAFVGEGTVASDDGSQGSVQSADVVDVEYELTVGLDFTIPVTGIQFEVNQVSDGLDLNDEEADNFAARVISAGGISRVENSTAFGVEVVVALAAGSLADDVDVFAEPGAIFLDTITVSGPPVNAAGVPQAITSDSVAMNLTVDETRVLFGDYFTAGIRIMLMPGTGGGGRGAIRPTDAIVVSAGVAVFVRRGSQ